MVRKMIKTVMVLGCIVVWGMSIVEAAPKMEFAQTEPTEKEFIDPITGMEFVYVPGGCFQMGNSNYVEALPVHEVCVRGFYMGKYEVTQEQWQKIMGSNPSKYQSCGPNCPVDQVSWNDVQGYISKLSALGNTRYRLPTEAEWEYAARSGGKDEEWAGTNSESNLSDYAWYNKNSDSPHPVGQKKPNNLGLYDMSGNVFEWCSDWFNIHYYILLKNGTHDPKGPKTGKERVYRGGAWNANNYNASTVGRRHDLPGDRRFNRGFRIVFQ